MSTSAPNCTIAGQSSDYTIALTQDGQSVIVYKGDWYQIFPRGEALSFTDQTVNTDYLFNGGAASASVSVAGCAADYTIALTQDGLSVIVYKGDWYQILPKGTSIAFTDQSVNTDYLFNAGGSASASVSVNGCAADYTIALTQDSQSIIVYKGDWYQILPKGTSIAFTDKTVNTDYLFNGETCPTNHDPDAIDDAFSGVAGVAVTGNVLTNDTDADGDHLTVSLGQGPANGTLKLNADGTFSYAPKAGFTGSDSFTYQVSDGKGGCDMATVTIKVDPAPVVATASIGDRVWLDANQNGVQDAGEKGMAGVTVQLKDATGNVIATQTTDASGNYLFDKLAAGAYTVNVVKSWGYEFTTKDVANNTLSATDSDVDAAGKTDVINLAAGQKLDVVDAGLIGTASIGDRVWLDANQNGVQDAGEAGVAGVTVQLKDATGSVIATQTTNASGNYAFEHLAAGDYTVAVTKPDGYTFTTKDIASNTMNAADSDVYASGMTDVIHLAAGQKNTLVDAGLVTSTVACADSLKTCEDTAATINVLSNDTGVGLKLLSVKHESSALDSEFASRGGSISFTADGQVTYKGMTNYYGNDKLVYTVQDAAGKIYTQTVDVKIDAVSDAPTLDVPDNYQATPWNTADVNHIFAFQQIVVGPRFFGAFSDAADALQQFGSYNTGVASDQDTPAYVRLTGAEGNYGTWQWNGTTITPATQSYDIPWSDIVAGKLTYTQGADRYVATTLKFAIVDSGSTVSECSTGYIVSNSDYFKIYTPVGLDLNGDGKIGVTGQTSSFDKSDVTALGKTVKFDIDADGKLDTIEWFKGDGDGILVDASKIGSNGKIDGSALFGDEGGQFGNGYDKLALLDANGDGKLAGSELQTLKVWVDDGDAVLQPGELKSLADVGVAEISTRMEMVKDASGHDLMQSSATATDGSTILTEDVWFASAQNDHGAQAAHDAPVDHIAPQVEDMLHHQAHAA